MIMRLIKLYCYNIFSFKRALFYFILVFTYVTLIFSNNRSMHDILSPYPQSTSIREIYIYLYYQILIILPVGFFIDKYIRQFFLPYFIRIKSAKICYFSILIFSYIIIFTINLFIIIIGYYIFPVTISIIDLKKLIFTILNNIFIITLFIYIVTITAKVVLATLYITFSQIIVSNLILININFEKYNPFFEVNDFTVLKFLYIVIFISTIVLMSVKTVGKNADKIIENGVGY